MQAPIDNHNVRLVLVQVGPNGTHITVAMHIVTIEAGPPKVGFFCWLLQVVVVVVVIVVTFWNKICDLLLILKIANPIRFVHGFHNLLAVVQWWTSGPPPQIIVMMMMMNG